MRNRSLTGSHRVRVLLALAGSMALAGCSTVSSPTPKADVGITDPLYAWVQQGAGDAASARAILSADVTSCPSITVDGTPHPMSQRTTSPASFTKVRVCEYALSAASPPTSLSIGSLTLPPPTTLTDQILVFGDTGCRHKGSDQQDCHGDPTQGAWGFPAISQQAAATEPAADVILHVGDYLYRENGCDVCGYKWSAWQADFFQAAEASGLLRKAPWIFVRGNHEDCTRAWHGYFLFVAPGPWTDPSWPDSSCPTAVEPYEVVLDELNIYVVDTSSEDANNAQESYSKVNSMISGSSTDSWLTTHVPVCEDYDCDGDMGQAFAASGLDEASQLKWIHVGHIHLFEQIDAKAGDDPHPPQTITGGSGTELYPSDCAVGDHIYCDAASYTYMMVSSESAAWEATLYDLQGQATKRFTIPK